MRLSPALEERVRLVRVYDTLNRYAVDAVFDGLGGVGRLRRRLQSWWWDTPVEQLPLPVRFRLLLQDLGPTYVKLGQIVSSQARALPSDWERELSKLQSDVAPFPYEQVREIVTAELGAPPDELYTSFDAEPLAAASLAQVHRATLDDGRPVVVKVQRPNIHGQLRSDVGILMRTAQVLERQASWAEEIDLVGVIQEFGTTLLRELDYTTEAYNARRLAAGLAPIPGIAVPEIDYHLSTSRVLTMEFVDGVKATDVAAIDAAGLDRRALAGTLVHGAVKMLLIDGFFHADPHPGNVLVELDTGRMVLLDTGMVGELDLHQRVSLGSLMFTARNRDVLSLAQTLKSLSTPFRDVDERRYYRDFERRVGPFLDPPPGERVQLVSKVIPTAMDVVTENGYRVDPGLTLGLKAMVQAEAITAALVPEQTGSEFASQAIEAIEELVPLAVTPDAIKGAVRKQATFVAREAMQRLPSFSEGALKWLDYLEKGQLSVKLDTSDLDVQMRQLRSISRLVTVAIVVVGLTIGSAIAAGVATADGSALGSLADMALVLYAFSSIAAALLIVGLLYRLWRPEGRRRRRDDLR